MLMTISRVISSNWRLEKASISQVTSSFGVSTKERMAERRRAWRDFIAARGLTACVVDLAASAPTADRTEPVDHALVDQERAALWQPAAT